MLRWPCQVLTIEENTTHNPIFRARQTNKQTDRQNKGRIPYRKTTIESKHKVYWLLISSGNKDIYFIHFFGATNSCTVSICILYRMFSVSSKYRHSVCSSFFLLDLHQNPDCSLLTICFIIIRTTTTSSSSSNIATRFRYFCFFTFTSVSSFDF